MKAHEPPRADPLGRIHDRRSEIGGPRRGLGPGDMIDCLNRARMAMLHARTTELGP
jgi:hypothetical protein